MILQTKTIALIKGILKSVAPPPDMKVSEWAENNVILSSEYAAIPGHYSVDRAPYQREIMDAYNDPLIQKIVVMSSSQVGKNTVINNIIGYIIDNDPGPILMIEPSIKMAEDYSKRRIAPLIRDTKCLKRKVADAKSRDSNNTILAKGFPGGSFVLVGSNSPRDLASKPIRVVIADEIDGFEPSAGTEGDPIDLAEKRAITFWNRKFIFVSTPNMEETSRIKPEYEAGTQEEWRLECPHCGGYSYINLYGIKFEHSKDDKGNYKVWNITYQCPACLEKFDEYTWKRQPGEWVVNNPGAEGVRSFKLNAFVSPNMTWKDIILQWLKVKNDPERHKVFVNTVLGECWEEKGEIEKEDFLLERREEYPVDLPDGVLLLTSSVDVQDDRLEYEVVGWGEGKQSWGIEYGFVFGKPNFQSTWDSLEDKISKTYSFANGCGLLIACTCVDSGGHYTDEVYKFCKKNEYRRVVAVKGMGGPGLKLIHKISRVNKEKSVIRTDKSENSILVILGVDTGKSNIMSRLKIKEIGDGYCHFPKQEERGYDMQYFKGLISERKVVHMYKGQKKIYWEKVSDHIRNEPLDLRNYATAAMELINPNFEQLKKRLEVYATGGSEVQNSPSKPPQKRYGMVNKGIEM